MKKINYSVAILILALFSFSFSTHALEGNNGWSAKYENSKVFIENKGQFHTNDPNEKVLYAYDNGSTMINFTSKGVTYSFLKRWKKEKDGTKAERKLKHFKSGKSHAEWEAEEHKIEFKTDVVSFIWENANPNVEIIPLEETFEYYSYCIKEKDGSDKNINHINAFKKIIYKNLYPNIDVEYVFHPTDGIKYSLILHPGADVSKVKMKYHDKVKLNGNGDLNISTLFGEIVEHAPVTFYSGNKSKIISSRFVKTDKTISFKLGEYDQTKTLIIDPWVQTPTLSNSNCVWECEKDGAGNVYIIGGDSPMKLRKYSATGTLVWTYNTPWDTANYWLGTLATDLAGNSYVTAGANAKIQKVDASGAMVWSNTGTSFDEYWTISFNCDQTKLIVGGTRLNGLPSPTGDGVIFDINTTNGNINALKVVGYKRTHTVFGFPVTDVEEVRSMTSSRGAKYYFLTLDSIGAIDQNFSACPDPSPLFSINHTYGFGYKCETYRPDNGNSGMKSIKANGDFVYTQNGANIHKRSLATGAILTTVAITGGVTTSSGGMNQAGNSGIDIDSCGNVYVGSGNAIIKYDANLNLITSVSLPFRVFDICVSYGGNVIVSGATGDNSNSVRTGYVQSINMTSCGPLILFCCNATVCPAGPFCTNDAPFTLTPASAGGTWGGTGVNPTTGVFSPAVAGSGTFTIIYTLPCGSDSITLTVSCCGAQINTAGPFCMSDAAVNLTAAAAGGTWSGPGITNAAAGTFSPSAAGTGTHTIVYTISGCGSDTLLITVSGCVTLTACQETNGDITATSGTGPYTWYSQGTTQDCSACAFGCAFPPGCAVNVTTWTSFATGTTITPPGTYPILFIDAAGDSLQITSLASLPNCSDVCPALTVTVSNIVHNSCFGQSLGSFDVSTSGGVSPWDYTLVNSGGTTVATFSNIAGTQSFTGLPADAYTLNVLDSNNCPKTIIVNITQPPTTTTIAAAGADQLICSNSTILAGNSPTVGTGLWTLISGTGTITNPSSATSGVTGLGLGTNVFEWTISNAPCSPPSSDQVTITNAGGGPSVNITSQTNVSCYGGNNGSATALATGGTGSLSYVWTPTGGNTTIANNLMAGTYTITVTDSNDCSGIETVVITQADSITAQVNTTSTLCGLATGSATLTASGGTGNLTYLWNNGGATTSTITNIGAGTYSVTITDSLGCTITDSGTVVISGGGPTATITSQLNVSCFGGNNGNATAFATGGIGSYTYLWNTSPAQQNDTAFGLTTGTYNCLITDSSGCQTTIPVTISQPSDLNINTGNVNSNCGQPDGQGIATATNATAPYSYLWNTSPVQTNDTATGLAAGTYQCIITDANNCKDTVAVTVTDNPASTISAVDDQSIIMGDSVQLFASAGLNYSWSPATGLSCTNCQSPFASPVVTTTYYLTVTDADGCSGFDTVIVTVTENEYYSIPNVFSPNNDGFNDLFELKAEGFKIYRAEIFNRWGGKIFETDDSKVYWNGKNTNGKEVSNGVYFYILYLTDSKDQLQTFKGFLTLVR